MKLHDFVFHCIECNGCGEQQVALYHNVDKLVKQLTKEGWRVTRSNNVLCPKCKRSNSARGLIGCQLRQIANSW